MNFARSYGNRHENHLLGVILLLKFASRCDAHHASLDRQHPAARLGQYQHAAGPPAYCTGRWSSVSCAERRSPWPLLVFMKTTVPLPSRIKVEGYAVS